MNVLDWLLQQDRVELAAAVVTLVSVSLAARNSVHTWWTGIVGCVLYGEVFLRAKLYPDVTLQGFYVVTSLLGWWAWLRGERGAPLPVRRSSAGFLLGVAALGMVSGLGYGALWTMTDAAAPYADALLAAFSVVGQLALSARRVESWWAWLLVNTIAVPLYASRGLWLTTWLYAVFWLNALLALPRWYALARRGGTA